MSQTQVYSYNVTFKVKSILKENVDNFYRFCRAIIQSQEPLSKNAPELSYDENISMFFPNLMKDSIYLAKVIVEYDNKWGKQIRVKGLPEVILPSDKDGLEKFLVSRVKGLGKKRAKQAIKIYGMDALKHIGNNPRALDAIGVSSDKAKRKIRQSVGELTAMHNLVTFFNSMNVPTGLAFQSYKHLGVESIRMIQENPYELTKINEMFFHYADDISAHLGYSPTRKERIEGAILRVLQGQTNNGHLRISKDSLYFHVISLLDRIGSYSKEDNSSVGEILVMDCLKELKRSRLIIEEESEEGDMIYLRNLLNVENSLVHGVSKLINDDSLPLVHPIQIQDYLHKLSSGEFLTEEQKKVGQKPFTPARQQEEAIYMALSNKLSILTGGPGTGKTTVLNTIVKILKHHLPDSSVALLAPTGKASKRLSEMTGEPAMTIHRKMKMFKNEDTGELHEIEEDFVIIDEFSMVDAPLASAFFNNISENTNVLLVGDVDQLPSVGPGLILRDFIDSEVISTTKLTEVFRQAQESQIVRNAYRVNNGEFTKTESIPGGWTVDESKRDMIFRQYERDTDVRKNILTMIDYYNRKLNVPIDEISVLSPMRKGGIGTNELNRIIQRKVNPKCKTKSEIMIDPDLNVLFREGDRVIQIENNQDLGVMNGETGVIDSIYETQVKKNNGQVKNETFIEVEVQSGYGTETISYTLKEAQEQLELAYAMTIHKSQGSEYRVVIIPFDESHRFMMKRNLIYTAMTRAKQHLVLVGNPEILNKGIADNSNIERMSGIREKIRKKVRTESAS